MGERPRLAVFGAGSIGCYVGGAWAAAGLEVTFIGRTRIGADLADHGLTVSDYDGWTATVGTPAFVTSPEALADAGVILLTVKSGGTGEAAEAIARHARPGTAVVSLQNGVGNVALLRRLLGQRHPVHWAMVPYNVVQLGEGRFHKGAAGVLVAEDSPATRSLSAAVAQSHEPLSLTPDMAAIAWGKLVINLNNAVNALSGRPLIEQLSERPYRRVVAACQAEALAALRSAGIAPAKVGPVPPRFVPRVLRAPNWLFLNLFMRGWKIDAHARSSMADDLAQGRVTEVDALNGEVVRLAQANGQHAPVNRKIVELIHSAEQGAPAWGPAALEREVLGR